MVRGDEKEMGWGEDEMKRGEDERSVQACVHVCVCVLCVCVCVFACHQPIQLQHIVLEQSLHLWVLHLVPGLQGGGGGIGCERGEGREGGGGGCERGEGREGGGRGG